MRGWLKILAGIAAVTAVLLIAWLVVSMTAGSGQDATDLVRQARAAMDSVAVHGTVLTVVRTPEGEREVSAEMHRGDGRFSMRILSGPGEGSQVHRQQGAVWVETREGRINRHADIGEPGMHPDLLARNWQFTTAGTRRVAGRTATLVRGSGPGGSMTMAIDRETNFPLYIGRRDPQGTLVSETTWQSVDFSVKPPTRVDALPNGQAPHRRRAVSLEEARAAVEFTVLEPGWVPAGWESQGWFVHEGARAALVQARFSDGMRPLVIVQRAAAQQPREGAPGARTRPTAGAENGAERTARREEWRKRAEQRAQQRRAPGAERPARRPQADRARRPLEHLRGAGADASRRQIDGTMVLVMGPISREERERVLDSMQAP